MATIAGPSNGHGDGSLLAPMAMQQRPQIGIDRLPVRRPSNNEPKEAMNCKSCRKRKAGYSIMMRGRGSGC